MPVLVLTQKNLLKYLNKHCLVFRGFPHRCEEHKTHDNKRTFQLAKTDPAQLCQCINILQISKLFLHQTSNLVLDNLDS